MGVFCGNYKVESLDDTIEVAYGAIVKLEQVYNDTWRATFAIAKTREKAKNNKAYERVFVEFVWDRKSDIVKVAYKKAKEQRRIVQDNPQTGKPEVVTVNGIFTGWVDDDKNL